MPKILDHRAIWEHKPILRLIYTKWYHMVVDDLAKGQGKTVEIGAGSGNFKEFYPKVVATDVEPSPWLDMVFDAHDMPFVDNSIANLVMIDTLHHLLNPMVFFREANRVLQPGGRIIMVEPYPSPFSLLVYRLFHPEPFIFNVDYFSDGKDTKKNKDPWESNQAIPYLLFFKHRATWQKHMDRYFKVVVRQKMSCLLYPLSGGFEHRSLIPGFAISVFIALEYLLTPLLPFMAFRCFVVVEKR